MSVDHTGAGVSRMRVAARSMCFLLATCAWSATALAHAPPRIFHIEWQQGGGDEIAMLTNRGILLADADGNWRLMCHTVLGINTSERPDYQLRSDGRLMVATSGGLRISDDHGCSWQPHGQFANIATPAMAWDPNAPEKLWIALRLDTGPSSVFTSEDGGEVWSELSQLDDGVSFDALAVAASDPSRVYASGLAVDASSMTFSYFVAASDDGGESWTRHSVSMEPNEGTLELLAVSPVDPDVIALVARDNNPEQLDRLLVSVDGGQTVTAAGDVRRLDSASFGTDGSHLWAAGFDGLFASDDLGQSLQLVEGTLDLSCVQEHGGELLVCGLFEGDVLGADGVGVSANGVPPFAPFMTFEQVLEPVDCDACSTTAQECQTWWRDWEIEVLDMPDPPPPPVCNPAGATDSGTPPPTPTPDAGTTPSPDAASPPPSASDDGCGCRVTGGRSAAGDARSGVWLSAIVLLLSVRVRRRRRPRSRRLGAPHPL